MTCPNASKPEFDVDYGTGHGHICDECHGTGTVLQTKLPEILTWLDRPRHPIPGVKSSLWILCTFVDGQAMHALIANDLLLQPPANWEFMLVYAPGYKPVLVFRADVHNVEILGVIGEAARADGSVPPGVLGHAKPANRPNTDIVERLKRAIRP